MIPVSFDITLFIVAILGAVVVVGMALLRQVLLFTERKRLSAAELQCSGLRKKQDHMTETYRRSQDRVRDTDVEIKSMHTQIAEVQRRLMIARADNFMIIHELGEPGGRRRLFTGHLTLSGIITVNQSSSKDGPLRGVRHQVDAWAENEAEALDLVRRTFPVENGFIVSKLTRADGEPGSASAAVTAPVRTKPMVRAAAE